MRTARLLLILISLLVSTGTSLAQENDSTVIVEVVDSAGQPIKSACVTFVPKTGDIVFRKADKRGRVSVKKLQKGNYRVVVKVDGYVAQKKELVVAGVKDTVAFVMHTREQR